MSQVVKAQQSDRQEFSWLALAAMILTLFTILTAIAAPVGSRIGMWNYDGAIGVLTWATYLAVAALILCVLGLIRSRPGSRYKGFLPCALGVLLLVPAIAIPVYWKNAKSGTPPIQDITTNTENPPEFWYAPNSRIYAGESVAVQQQEAYPDIKPYLSPLNRDQTFDLVVAVIEDFGWQLWEPSKEDGHVEATQTTFWFGFSDDIAVHVTAQGEGSKVDVRSTSRFGGGGDGGTNARRIRSLLQALDRRVQAAR